MIRGFQGWHERGYLPHRDKPGLTQFVTFHLNDSFPESLRSEWAHLLKIEDNHERRKKLEEYLDKGKGECHLRQSEIAEIVEDDFLLFHGQRYDLRAWVIMPNHVHLLFKVGEVPMGQLIGDWKKHSGRKAHRVLGKLGGFWADDYWDTYMRDGEHELKARKYMENNPVKAGMVREAKEWAWSSARFRDGFGNLVLPKRSAPL